jgi:hypothetical protein
LKRWKNGSNDDGNGNGNALPMARRKQNDGSKRRATGSRRGVKALYPIFDCLKLYTIRDTENPAKNTP